jgi:hypothetical protein
VNGSTAGRRDGFDGLLNGGGVFGFTVAFGAVGAHIEGRRQRGGGDEKERGEPG